MPLPVAAVLVAVGLGAAALASLISYFLTSNRARRHAAEYREKMQEIVDLLKERIADLRRRANEAKREARAAAERAATSEKEAAERKASIETLNKSVVEAEQRIRELNEQLNFYSRQASLATELVSNAERGPSVATTINVARIIKSSPTLVACKGRPERAITALDNERKRFDDLTRTYLHDVDSER